MDTSPTPGEGHFRLQSNLTLLPDDLVFGSSEAMKRIRQKVAKVAGANVPVLICGANGTGKEVIARLIHARSPWASGPFVKVNCAAIPGALIESELFGYQKGAFTGAYAPKPGRVELAENGTLFLDEIAELESGLQAKLLQVLQDGQFCPIGGQEDKCIEARVICATNRDLQAEIERGTFRQDLFYRINVVTIQLPPLRERAEDIPAISEALRVLYSQKFNRSTPALSPRKLEVMQRYRWPGNIRELENLIKRYVILGSEDVIQIERARTETISFESTAADDGALSLKAVTRQALKDLESKIIVKTLQANNWNRRRAASALDISYRALLYKLKEAGFPTRKGGPQGPTADSLDS